PEPCRAIFRGGDDARPVGGEARTRHGSLMPDEAEALRTRRSKTGPTRGRAKIGVVLGRSDEASYSLMVKVSEAPIKLSWKFLRVRRQRWQRECNRSADMTHPFILALGQVTLEQPSRSGCAQLRLDPGVVGQQPV